MRTLSLLIFTLFCTISAIAQPWIGPDAGNIYHNQGNVGIGTTSPGSLGTSITTLQIVGGSTIPSTRSGGWRLTSYDASLDAYGYFAHSIFYLGTGSNHDMSLLTNGVERLTILKGGNVGIGTTGPSSKLAVEGVSYTDLRIGQTAQTTGSKMMFMGVNVSSTFAAIGATQWGAMSMPLVLQPDGGNVGIGTTGPHEKLEVNGNLMFGLSPQVGSYGGLKSGYGGSGTAASIDFYRPLADWGDNGEIRFSTNPGNNNLTQRMVINNQGNVGIGTTTPEAKLTVKGKIVASEIQVKDVGAIPDYVFKPDYVLMPLSHVEEFVKQNQHLPEVPSEKEFKENGMNVAEMNTLLLKKIEELTLYAIKQNKKIEELTLYSIDQNKNLKDEAKKNEEQAKKIETLEKTVNNLISK